MPISPSTLRSPRTAAKLRSSTTLVVNSTSTSTCSMVSPAERPRKWRMSLSSKASTTRPFPSPAPVSTSLCGAEGRTSVSSLTEFSSPQRATSVAKALTENELAYSHDCTCLWSLMWRNTPLYADEDQGDGTYKAKPQRNNCRNSSVSSRLLFAHKHVQSHIRVSIYSLLIN